MEISKSSPASLPKNARNNLKVNHSSTHYFTSLEDLERLQLPLVDFYTLNIFQLCETLNR